MYLNFTKMHGLGNDFVVIDNLDGAVALSRDQICYIADRHTGVGFDQLLVLDRSDEPDADIRYRIYNADGSQAGQCGNGARCIGMYLYENGIVNKREMTARTGTDLIKIVIDDDGAVRVNMGMPRFEPDSIPITAEARQDSYQLMLDCGAVSFHALSMGNPHAVVLVEDSKHTPVEQYGSQIQSSPFFPDSVNVGFMQILDRKHIRLRVYERGVGETLACGTGACAAAVAGIANHHLDHEVIVGLQRGNLIIDWQGEGSEVWMTGPATTVFQGQIRL